MRLPKHPILALLDALENRYREKQRARKGICRCGLPLLITGKYCTGGHYQRRSR